MTVPAVAALVAEHRAATGMGIREAARKAGLSDSFWGQVERGLRAPSVGSLLHIARTLRLTDEQTDALVESAGHPALPARPGKGAAGAVDTTGLSREDVRLLNSLAARLRS